jgi:hypothetical protein
MSEDVTIRAARAQQLLEDETLLEAFGGYNKDALAKLLMVDLSNSTECVAAVASFQASQEFLEKLREYVTAGKAAERKPYKVA